MCNILKIMYQPKLSDGKLYFVIFFVVKMMAFVSRREIAVHYTALRRGSRRGLLWMPYALWVAYGLQAATQEWFDTRNETIYLLQDHCSSLTARIYTLVNEYTNSFDQISLILSIRGRICDFLPWTLSRKLHSDWERQAQCVMGWLTGLWPCDKQIVSMPGCNCIAKILKEKWNQWLLLLIISLRNLICCRTVAKLT